MSVSFFLADPQSLSDLRIFLGRSARIEEGAIRLLADGHVLAASTVVLQPRGILDRSATVLALRVYGLAVPTSFDRVVRIRALSERLARVQWETEGANGTPVILPEAEDATAGSWAGISPPRGGWSWREPVDAGVLEQTARAGIEEITAAVGAETGEQIVSRVRSSVWGRPLDGLADVPAGAAFALFALGFLRADDPVALFDSGRWRRLTTRRGHVLVRTPA
ncbi:hypothetical protein [Rathayibacter toxicus]|uniref:hypothetical protein n=1 Tax=Rathayibacter toxicus TaxID=145458 RepID=UPI000CE78234|nr:hypothetical protein [Rathayibacter toxicus]PPI55229.1 hypothetical protein C5D35_05790 [Rathayibacter toxicus]QOD09518.1 hypothetical protein BSG36_05880 [Rathayibacter toxicus]QWL28187.1 hypothetical protein E2R33_05885 [Rathayibacter toxicus]